ncbi:TetR/AcrR family transcriptional regulator [Paracoccus sp. 11-3]|uniref:TetR/AcrR family transcriptional regulator n=1 Tax=Paracoccus amoyensis TaxID=2760093 RepID=A0A926GGM6_9RHOB|nr:TetR/AcrR family transcriptional regulator [Paracoccus amoyensis]MBC9246979.1 TetR/AcrR family transcriptional regulator [Paracoccus amoyensis]
MARPRKIDRDQLLDAAEELVREKGAAALTIDALAKACGITKGGVQYSFRSKDDILNAMFDRWYVDYDRQFSALVGDPPAAGKRVAAHVAATRQGDAALNAKAASLMAALLQTPEHLESTRQWYRERLAGVDATTPEGRRQRLAFLATEGAFLLRFMRFMQIDDDEWDQIFADIATLLEGNVG